MNGVSIAVTLVLAARIDASDGKVSDAINVSDAISAKASISWPPAIFLVWRPLL